MGAGDEATTLPLAAPEAGGEEGGGGEGENARLLLLPSTNQPISLRRRQRRTLTEGMFLSYRLIHRIWYSTILRRKKDLFPSPHSLPPLPPPSPSPLSLHSSRFTLQSSLFTLHSSSLHSSLFTLHSSHPLQSAPSFSSTSFANDSRTTA